MSSTKRKALESTLQRRVRARRDLSEEPEDFSDSAPPSEQDSEDSGSDSDAGSGSELDAQEQNPDADGDEDNNSDSDSDASSSPEPDLASSISFGALAKAQSALSAPRSKSKSKSDPAAPAADGWTNNEALERKAGHKDHRDFSRRSKHAPTEVSSKKAVSRKRDVLAVAKRDPRDPRFEPITGPVDTALVARKYDFLNAYRDDEIAELKAGIRKVKDEGERERLKRQLLSMESRRKADARKAKEQEILDRHRKEEKELVKQGKQPFYLKKAEQKNRLLVEQYKGLKGKQLDHVLERKRKKVEGKEKKKMPWARRERE